MWILIYCYMKHNNMVKYPCTVHHLSVSELSFQILKLKISAHPQILNVV